jgi:RNA polymerase sigma-70 factor (ECF subfamily)
MWPRRAGREPARIAGTSGPPVTITTRMQAAAADRATDADLMRLAAAGDRRAFGEVYERHHAMVYRFGRLMTGSNELAEDVVQDVFLAVMRDAHRYDAQRSALPTYLYAIARHRTRRLMLRSRRVVAADDSAEIDLDGIVAPGDVLSDIVRIEALRRMRAAILRLPSRYREAVVLCDVQGLSYEDAARVMGCAVGTVRSRLHRARQMLIDRVHPADRAVTRGAVRAEGRGA